MESLVKSFWIWFEFRATDLFFARAAAQPYALNSSGFGLSIVRRVYFSAGLLVSPKVWPD